MAQFSSEPAHGLAAVTLPGEMASGAPRGAQGGHQGGFLVGMAAGRCAVPTLQLSQMCSSAVIRGQGGLGHSWHSMALGAFSKPAFLWLSGSTSTPRAGDGGAVPGDPRLQHSVGGCSPTDPASPNCHIPSDLDSRSRWCVLCNNILKSTAGK